ncbi:UNVERIFIED_CONTAM: hypothetical protein NCL1_55795 [Trichonephila clavipes]
METKEPMNLCSATVGNSLLMKSSFANKSLSFSHNILVHLVGMQQRIRARSRASFSGFYELLKSIRTFCPPETTNEIIFHSFPDDCENNNGGCHKETRNGALINSNVMGDPSFTIHEIDAVINIKSRIWDSTLKKKTNCRLLRKIQRRILLRVISGYRTISYEDVFAISDFPPIEIFIIRNYESKIAMKNCTNTSLDGSLRVYELPHPSERFPLNLVNYCKNVENNFPVVCFTNGSKINNKVGLAFVIFQDFVELETRQFLE